MKKISLFLTLCIGLFAFSACGETATEKATEPETKKTEEKNEEVIETADDSKPDETPKDEKAVAETDTKADDVKPGEVVSVDEAVASILKDEDGSMGKEFAVKGKVTGVSNSGNLNTVTVKSDDKESTTNSRITCKIMGPKLENVLGKNATVKGKVSKIGKNNAWLDSCKLVSGGE